MPKLWLFNRSWALATDDFVAPSGLSLYIRFLSLGLIIAVLVLLHNKLLKCNQPYFYVSLYLYGTLAIIVLMIINDLAVFCLSRRGAIMDEKPRRHVPKFLAMRVVFSGIELGWTIFGTVVVAYKFPCDTLAHAIIIAWVAFSWLMLVLFLIAIVLFFDPLGSTPCDSEDYPVHSWRVWKIRIYLLRMLMCRYTHYEEMEDVARLFQEELRHNELVYSDIAAAFILLSKKQKDDAARFFNEAYRFALENQLPQEHADRVMHFFKFASAAYGWPNFVFENRYNIREVFFKCKKTVKPHLISQEGECFGHYNTKTILSRAGMSPEDLIVVSFNNTIHEVPFYVAVDHESKNIIVGVRGTQSLSDVITDMLIAPAPILWGYPDNFKAHKGMLAAANYVHNKMRRIGALEYAIENWPGYGIAVCGHSLGAGVAGLLTFILRQQEDIKVPVIHGYCYAPPGVLLSEEAAEFSKSFISCGVVECDIVPRMSLGALRRLERELNEVLFESKLPKNQLFFGSIADCVGRALPCFKCFKWKTDEEKLEELKKTRRKEGKKKRNAGDENEVICVSPGDCEAQIGRSDEGMRSSLLSEDCHCGMSTVDNSRANSHVIPHERHDASNKHVIANDSGAVPILAEDERTNGPFSHSSFSRLECEGPNRLPRQVIDNSQIGATIPMYPPGVTLYFERYDPDLEDVAKVDGKKKLPESSHFVKYVKEWKEYRYFWIKQSFFDRIFLADRMFKSHFPYALDYAIVLGQRRIDIFTDQDAFPRQHASGASGEQNGDVIEFEGIVQ